MRFILWAFVIMMSANMILPAQAQAPVPSSHPVTEIEQEQEERTARQQALKKEQQSIQSELKNKKGKLVSLAKDIRKNEKELLDLEKQIDGKQRTQLSMEASLEKDRQSLSKLILALQRIERVPPEALIARPGAPLKTAQSAMLLQTILPQIYTKAEELKRDLNELQAVIYDLKDDRNSALKIAKDLEQNQQSLNKALKERERLYASTEQDIERNKREMARLSAQASSLRDLVAKIEKKQQAAEAQRRAAAASAKVEKVAITTPVPKAGKAQLPLSGIITTQYGKTDDIGAVSKGLKIQGRPNALIVAPMGGVIDYAGPFKGYGEIIIIRHKNGYHSLVAGLAKIDTVVGRAVNVGEPIGAMGSSPAPLYYELRYNGQPVNPSKKIAGL